MHKKKRKIIVGKHIRMYVYYGHWINVYFRPVFYSNSPHNTPLLLPDENDSTAEPRRQFVPHLSPDPFWRISISSGSLDPSMGRERLTMTAPIKPFLYLRPARPDGNRFICKCDRHHLILTKSPLDSLHPEESLEMKERNRATRWRDGKIGKLVVDGTY